MVRTQSFSKILYKYIYKYNSNLYNFKYKKKVHLILKLNCINNFLFYKTYFYKTYFFSKKNINNKILLLNFKRNRFFPSILNFKGNSYINLSLGIFFKYFLKPKPFKISKQMYILLITFLRKIILYANIKNLSLFLKKTPKYLNELLNHLINPTISFYNHPFSGATVDEKQSKPVFTWSNITFLNNKPYGKIKYKKKGRLKRKILKRITQLNSISD